MWTEVTNGTLKFTYDPSKNIYPDRYKEGSTYKLIYFYGSGYDAVASATFTVGKKLVLIVHLGNALYKVPRIKNGPWQLYNNA